MNTDNTDLHGILARGLKISRTDVNPKTLPLMNTDDTDLHGILAGD
jgi:hypothetical protein